jgi:hypothetical protein
MQPGHGRLQLALGSGTRQADAVNVAIELHPVGTDPDRVGEVKGIRASWRVKTGDSAMRRSTWRFTAATKSPW